MANVMGSTFDDVFRTIALKMPQLMISLINEVFGESYPYDIEVTQLRNEFVSEAGKVISDSIFYIGGKYYHIECQSNPDTTMEIRMVEYDFVIAHEHAKREDGKYVIRFPESAVLYLRHNKNTPDKLCVLVKMPDGQSIEYSTKVLKAQNYTKDEIFQKKLLVLLPFYLMRYEDEFPLMDTDSSARDAFLAECEDLRDRIASEVEPDGMLYHDLIRLILKFSNHLLVKHPKTRKGVKNVMGGKILTLPSDQLKKEHELGRKEGFAEGHAEGQTDGQNILISAITSLQEGASPDDLKNSGFDDRTISLAVSVTKK